MSLNQPVQGSRHITIQRNNLINVCKMAVKSLIDKSSYQVLEPECDELINFCAILEHVLNFRIKADTRWFSIRQEPFCFWNYIQKACANVTHSCIESIENLEKVNTSRGKGRAWIRMVLMEKRLAEYLTVALQQRKLTRNCYNEGAIVLSEEISEICGVLMGLSAIDFSFDLRTQDLDFRSPPVVDFSPYMKFEQTPKSVSLDMRESNSMPSLMTASVSSEVFDDEEHCQQVKVHFLELDRQYRTISEQKGYLEELLRVRESQLGEMRRQQRRVMETLAHYQEESKKERQQLESVIIELQAQINSMRGAHEEELHHLRSEIRRMNTKTPRVKQPDIVLQDMASIPRTPRPPLPGKSFLNSPEIVVKYASSHARPIQFDTRSVLSDNSVLSIAKEDTQSLVPLTGSLTSNEQVFDTSQNTLTVTLEQQPVNVSTMPSAAALKATEKLAASSTSLSDDSKPDLVVNCADPEENFATKIIEVPTISSDVISD